MNKLQHCINILQKKLENFAIQKIQNYIGIQNYSRIRILPTRIMILDSLLLNFGSLECRFILKKA